MSGLGDIPENVYSTELKQIVDKPYNDCESPVEVQLVGGNVAVQFYPGRLGLAVNQT